MTTEPSRDAELTRLLDAYAGHYWAGAMAARGRTKDSHRVAAQHLMLAEQDRDALLAHIAQHYVRRDQSDPWGAVLESVGDTMPARLTGRGPARAARYGKGELADDE